MIVRKRRAPQVRNILGLIKARVARRGATSEEIVETLRREHPDTIAVESADILHIGLVKLANETCSLRTISGSPAQIEMFSEYATQRMVTLRTEDAKGRTRKVHKAVEALTLGEARRHIVEHTKQRPKRSAEISELARLVDDVERFAKSDLNTLAECWQRKRKSA